MPKVSVPAALRGPTRGEAVIEVAGETIGACLDAVEERFPGFREQVLAADGSPHRFVKLFVNGEQVEGTAVAVAEADEIEVLAAIGGG